MIFNTWFALCKLLKRAWKLNQLFICIPNHPLLSNYLLTYIQTYTQTRDRKMRPWHWLRREGLSFELILSLATANTHIPPIHKKEEHISSFKTLFFSTIYFTEVSSYKMSQNGHEWKIIFAYYCWNVFSWETR